MNPGATDEYAPAVYDPVVVAELVTELVMLLKYVNEKVVQHYGDALTDHAAGHLRRVAAASLIRVPNSLNAVIRLGKGKLGLEAHTIVRTIVEMAIALCWVGLDEKRAQAIWDKSVEDFTKGIDRAREHQPAPQQIADWMAELRSTQAGTNRPSVKRMAAEALDTPELQGCRMAKQLYDFLYDPLSAASHGDLRFARLVLNGGDAAFVSSAFVYAAGATEFLLIAASAQLGFRPDLEDFLRVKRDAIREAKADLSAADASTPRTIR